METKNQQKIDLLVNELVSLTYEEEEAEKTLERVRPEISRIKARLRELGDEDYC